MNAIGLREAAEKYNIPRSTLSHWVAAGLIRKLQEAEKRGQAVLLLESDIVALLPQYTGGPGRGRRPRLDNLPAAS